MGPVIGTNDFLVFLVYFSHIPTVCSVSSAVVSLELQTVTDIRKIAGYWYFIVRAV